MISNQDMIDRFCLFTDKINCSARVAIKNNYTLHTDNWNIVYVPSFTNSKKLIWRERNVAGIKRIHPLAYILIGHPTITCNKHIDIERLMGLPAGIMDAAFARGFVSDPAYYAAYAKEHIALMDKQYDTNAYTMAYNLGLYCMNIFFGYPTKYTLPDAVMSNADKVFRGLLYARK